MEGFPQDISTNDLSTFPGKAAPTKKRPSVPKKQREPENLTKVQIEKAEELTNDVKLTQTVDKRLAMRRKIQQYQDKLGHLISYKVPKLTEKSSFEKVQEALYNIETDLAMRGAVDGAQQMYINAIVGLEKLTNAFNPLNLHLSGPQISLTSVIAANKERWDDMVTEVAIQYSEYLAVGPLRRLLFFTGQTILTVHSLNKIGVNGDRPASDGLQETAETLP